MREMKDSGVPWIGKIAKGATVYTLKYNTYMKGRIGWQGLKSQDFIDEGPYCVTSTDFENGKVNWDTCYHVSLDRYNMDPFIQIKKGDLLISKDGTIGKLALIDDLPDKACLNSHLLIIRPLNQKYVIKYLYYVLQSSIFTTYYALVGNGSTMQSLSQEKLGQFKFPIWDITTQKHIVAFLDTKCSDIDAATADIQSEIDTLEKYKRSVITEAVTKGLDKNVEMKDSGIDWVGEVPVKWRVIKAKYLVKIDHGCDPVLPGEIPVYGSGAKSFKSCGEYKLGPTVLLGRKGATLHIPHYIEGKYWNVDTAFDVHPISGSINLKYFYYCSICFDYTFYISQTTLPGMTQQDYKNMKLPHPSLNEQTNIVKYLDSKCADIDTAISQKQQQLEILNKYKKSLIYEYVTGKKEVPSSWQN